MTASLAVIHTLSLSARLASLEADVAGLNDLRRQRAELDVRIADGEEAERLLAEVRTILLPLLSGEAPRPEPVATEVPEVEEALGLQDVQAQDEEPTGQEQSGDQTQEPPAADAVDDLDEEEWEERPAPYPLSARAQVLDWVRSLPLGQQFSAQDCADGAALVLGTVKIQLRKLSDKGEIEVVEGTGFPGNPFRYARPVPEQTTSDDEIPTLLPIPSRLSTDECSLFDALRRAPDGMSARLLCARLNWNSNRVAQALERLQAHGHVSCALGVFQVMGYVGRHEEHVCALAEDLRDNGAAD